MKGINRGSDVNIAPDRRLKRAFQRVKLGQARLNSHIKMSTPGVGLGNSDLKGAGVFR